MRLRRDKYHFQERGGFTVDATVKRGAEHLPFQRVPDPELCVVFLRQHIGPPNEPLVGPGDRVTEGQKIGDGEGHMCVPVHAPVTGRVSKIDTAYHPGLGAESEAVFIERASEETPPLRLSSFDPDWLEDAEPDALVDAVREAGVVGLGGAGFPAHVKLSFRDKVEYLVINAKESDPNVACDVRLKQERPAELVAGIRAMSRMLEVKGTIFATRAQRGEFPELEERLHKAGVEIAHIRPSYSVGSDKLLVKELLNVEVPCGAYPPDVGAVVHNVFTAYAVARGLFDGEPLTSRGITFISRYTGPRNLWVKVGTPMRHVLEHMGIPPDTVHRLAVASMLMGGAVPHADVPLVKATAAISAFDPQERSPYERERACIRCGYCNMVCPVSIYPVLIMEAEKHGQRGKLRRLHAEDCIDCGLCSYVCPSLIKLTGYLRRAMAEVKQG